MESDDTDAGGGVHGLESLSLLVGKMLEMTPVLERASRRRPRIVDS